MKTKLMAVSHNELLSLFKRVFEALYNHDLDFEALARNQLMLEVLGLGGWHMLGRSLSELEKKTSIHIYQDVKPNDAIVIDAKSNNLMAFAPTIGDLVLERAMIVDSCTAEILNARDAIAFVPQLVRIADNGFSTTMYWSEEKSNAIQNVEIKAGQNWPTMTTKDHANSSPFLRLFVARDLSVVNQMEKSLEPTLWELKSSKKDSFHISSDDFKTRYESGLNDGLLIDHEVYKKLCKIADLVLVEASEASRRGAGD